MDILYRRQAEVLCRGHIAEEVCPIYGCKCAAYSRCDMIVSGCNICHQRTKHIEWRAVTNTLFESHIGSDLVIWHVPRSFNHHLYATFPRALRQLTYRDKLCDLCPVSRIRQAARTQAIAEAYRNIILSADIKDIIITLIKRIFLFIVQHPSRYE